MTLTTIFSVVLITGTMSLEKGWIGPCSQVSPNIKVISGELDITLSSSVHPFIGAPKNLTMGCPNLVQGDSY